MKIQVQLFDYWKKKTYYPMCELSRTFCSMLKQKSLTQADIEYIKRLGYEIDIQVVSLPRSS